MPYDPLNYIAEILGEPAPEMRSPANAGYICPFYGGTCTKTSHALNAPYPVCSVFRRGRAGPSDRPPICVCPKRFYEAPIKEDVIAHAWAGDPPENPRVVYEISMEKFGTVDFVLADFDRANRRIKNFVSVELQAVDITGSYYSAYEAVTNSTMLLERPTYGFNWANVRKRFVSQLIAKGFYHHHWGTRIVAVLQADLFDQLQGHAQVPPVPLEQSNIVFVLYQFAWEGDRWSLSLDRVVPTTHSLVMNAVLYETPPSRNAFERRILERLRPDF